MLLCDYAEEVNGKLYIMGGGWSRVSMRSPTASMAVAVRIEVPWDQANIGHQLVAALVTEDGQPVLQDDSPIQLEGQFEVGRPPGMTRGSPIVSAFALRFEGLSLDRGRYRWQLSIDGTEAANTWFEVIKEGSP
jgi:hypothetical protein